MVARCLFLRNRQRCPVISIREHFGVPETFDRRVMAALNPSVPDSLLEGDDQTEAVVGFLEDLTVSEAEAKVLNDEEQAMDTEVESKDSTTDPKPVVTEQKAPAVPVEDLSKVGSPIPEDDDTDKLHEAVGGVPPTTTPVHSDEEKPTKEVDSEDGSGKRKKKRKKRKETPHASDSSAAEATNAEPEQEGWSTVESSKQRKSRARKARAEDRLAKDGRKNVRLEDLLGPDGRRYFTPPRQTVEGSDDEDWMDDFSHPIDWYVSQIDEICDVPSPAYSKELRRKLKYAWKNYVPGDPCSFDRCQHRPKGARVWTSLPRYARHLVETHLPKKAGVPVRQGGTGECVP